MKCVLVCTVVLVLAAVSGSALAFTDDFDSYATGPLSVVSGGVWNTWGGASTDAQVTAQGLSLPNAQYHDGINVPDVVTYWGDLFGGGGGGGGSGAFSFDFLVHEEGQDDMDTYVFAGSGNPGALDINYGSAIGIFILDWGGSLGSTTLHIWDTVGANGGGDYGIIELATGLSLDVWYNLELRASITVADRTANAVTDADGVFEVWLNGLQVLGPTSFGLDDPLGWNATEIYSYDAGGETPERNDYMLFDNVSAVPEPGLLALLGLGVIAALRRRR